MERIKLKIHPLFYVFGVYYLLIKRLPLFILYTLTALIHESGHSFMAEKLGYKLKNITLMPYGAVINGNIDGLKFKDETLVALSGPFLNFCIAIFFIALWWLFPKIYAYTDVLVEANLSLFLINLLPAYPLDGGRVLSSLIKQRLSERTANVIIKSLGATIGVLFSALFVASCFYTVNVSLLLFALFIFAGVFSREKENRYVKLYSVLNKANLKRGVIVKKLAVDGDITIKRLLRLLDTTALNEIDVYVDGKRIRTLSQKELSKVIEKNDIYKKLKNAILS